MTTARRGILIGSLLALSAEPTLAAEMTFVGTAKTDSEDTLYVEEHRVSGTCQDGVFRPQDHEVDYRRPGETKDFASKSLNYANSVVRPAVDFHQPGFTESLSIQYPQPDTLVINWQKPEGGTKTFNVPFSDEVVVDAGFDNFVRRHWESVVNGDSVEFRFLGPTRGEHYAFVLEPADSYTVTADHVVQIRPTGLVLRFLVDPIVLGYDSNGALTDYKGLTNIRKNTDTNYTAHIRYSVSKWPDCELTP